MEPYNPLPVTDTCHDRLCDLLELHPPGVELYLGGRPGNEGRVHKGACINQDIGTLKQGHPPDGDKVGISGSGTDKITAFHLSPSCIEDAHVIALLRQPVIPVDFHAREKHAFDENEPSEPFFH